MNNQHLLIGHRAFFFLLFLRYLNLCESEHMSFIRYVVSFIFLLSIDDRGKTRDEEEEIGEETRF